MAWGWLPALLFIVLAGGCKITQELKPEEKLVNKIEIEGIKKGRLREEAKMLVKQKPNKRLFGFYRFYLRAYNYGMRGDTSRWIRRKVRQNIGEPPVIFDSAKLIVSAAQLKALMFNNGYFNATVSTTITYKGSKNQKAKIKFTIVPDSQYRLREISYGVDDKKLYKLILSDTSKSLLKKGNYFNSEKMGEERERITRKLRNEGYYFFNKEYITFSVDSNVDGRYVDVNLQITNPDYFVLHKKYYIKNVYINVVNPVLEDSLKNQPSWKQTDSIWINLNGYHLKEEVILRNLAIRPGEGYRQIDVDNTYGKLNSILLFRQAGISFEKDTVEGFLNCNITIVPGKKQEWVIEPQVITSDQNNAIEQNNQRNYGIASILQHRNKNLFNSAEMLDIRYRVSFESQISRNDTVPLLSNIEHNITTTLGLPRTLVLKKLGKRLDITGARSQFFGNYIYESNIDFKRNVLAVGYNEIFNYKLHSFNITLAELSYNRTNAKRNFLALVNPADSIFIANLFTTNIISNSRVVYVYTDNKITRNGSYFYSRSILEAAGNSLYTFMKLTGQPLPADGRYKVDKVDFEQFVKIDQDMHYKHVLDDQNTMAYRLHLGAGIPYGNSEIMPFVRRYFIGGANSLRGWRPRTLGPGSFSNSTTGVRADRSGEMIIEAQTEYRFTIIRSLLQGALFADGGNIWYTKPIAGKAGIDFTPTTFIGQMALNTGIGLRFDFSIFIVRFDFGLPLRNPERAVNNRWLFNEYGNSPNKIFSSTILNLGLGYPFAL